MAPSIIHLPNGQTLTVTPVFGGIQFKANDLNTHHNAFPPGWTIVINSEDEEDGAKHHLTPTHSDPDATPRAEFPLAQERRLHLHRYRRPTLRSDHMFISSISNPSSHDFRPPTSPTRQIAMMLWATLWWYFHQPAPPPHLITTASAQTPEEGRPKGEWRVHIDREGIFKGKHLLPKLERMGIVATEDSTVGVDPGDGVTNAGMGWSHMFISQRTFWQLDPRIYLFTLTPTQSNSPYPSISPAPSRSGSPSRPSSNLSTTIDSSSNSAAAAQLGRSSTPPGPFTSSSHLPTFYPPPPTQYIFSSTGVRHPIRPKPPRQGEVVYTRWIPSLGQYLSFRVASLSKQPCAYSGPISTTTSSPPDSVLSPGTRESLRAGTTGTSSLSEPIIPTLRGLSLAPPNQTQQSGDSDSETCHMSDVELLHKWMNTPRVAHSWGETGPLSHQEAFLTSSLTSRHSLPLIGLFDGQPFGFFEVYWVKEDRLAPLLGGDGCGDFDRGLHVLVGEQEFRGSHRVRVWLAALVHYAWLADLRTGSVVLEPRVDNVKLKQYCEEVGFHKEREVAFPHKQSNLMRIRRETWTAPAL
ncbi:hypothetical protein LTR57_003014 [Friedmanniomyces endolithicus]|uniref:Acyltransferase MbtK/IucB-like conserved domain-containing protein n=1 Tax=Friedmanniomyces endolithicus TaxID=329885 RepID=A0AAN6FX85_9PEZI|nr:hypothetical protein LTR35_004088 [Friedmanniomyces endolithicus]KAK0300091.1 hypothetical protein LTS00_001163 [Friedmanniomyces endolithicus]KAK0325106.1 hypothetical protein LTR82_004092 [Friedmanniomyces endolithicus]KAK0927771.1 hypothetical protein LTR57_003014 [Friedmanniomyces endolithicus]KAK0999395.1 hypothetical protein LTR54_009140 [Friedmanniomyces endolithicus]